MNARPIFELQGASIGYSGAPVLREINLTIREGEKVAIMGRSGVGKSTLIRLLYAQRAVDVALIPQTAALVRTLSVFHNVFMGRLDQFSTLHNLRTLVWPCRRDLREIQGVLERVGIAEKLRHSAGTLSGGQGQRASVGRALYSGRPVVIGDEPVSALDRVHGCTILDELRRCHKTMVLVLHDIAQALEFTDRVLVLEGGRIVLDKPSHALAPDDLQQYYVL